MASSSGDFGIVFAGVLGAGLVDACPAALAELKKKLSISMQTRALVLFILSPSLPLRYCDAEHTKSRELLAGFECGNTRPADELRLCSEEETQMKELLRAVVVFESSLRADAMAAMLRWKLWEEK